MIKPFEYYIQENLVRKTVPNISMARSFIVKAEIRLRRVSSQKINDEESSLIFEDIYEALRESSQSLMELKGYKPYSHEALISFIKENKILNENEINLLDKYRILRNNSVYLAEKVSVEKCREALEFSSYVLPKLKKKFEESI